MVPWKPQKSWMTKCLDTKGQNGASPESCGGITTLTLGQADIGIVQTKARIWGMLGHMVPKVRA